MSRCPDCDSADTDEIIVPETVYCGRERSMVFVEIPVIVCSWCGGKFHGSKAEDIITKAVEQHNKK